MIFELKNSTLFINSVKFDIPNITFIEEIGNGANAKVFLANNNLLARKEAVKIWVPRGRQQRVDERRFCAEVQKNAKVSFPNIAKFYDAKIEGLFYYARLEYIQGQTLELFLEHPQELVIRYMIITRVLETMALVYNACLYHGDLHTKNIIINNNVPFIIDFGTSLFSGAASSQDRDCTMLIDLCYRVYPELYKFEFIVKEELIRQGSLVATRVLLHILPMSWHLETEISSTRDEYSCKNWQFWLGHLTEEFSFINMQNVRRFLTKHILV
ncbi:protein kinase [Blautia schinkii]|nr:protein kinase [Blautia schinkii]